MTQCSSPGSYDYETKEKDISSTIIENKWQGLHHKQENISLDKMLNALKFKIE